MAMPAPPEGQEDEGRTRELSAARDACLQGTRPGVGGTVRADGYYNQGLGHNVEYVMQLGQPKITGVVAGAVRYSTTFFVLRDGSLLASGPFLPSPEKMYKVPTVIVKAPGR
jgi:hypothetical protein